ncbi:MAG: hypothetical protein J6S89_09900 [Paludibacteraceae bacterium]|nr:hypothetical protein [Paludibacteraceae bacterium]
MKERIIKALFFLGCIVLPVSNSRGQCDVVPDNYLSCNSSAQIYSPNSPDQNLQNGQTYKIVTPGQYTFNLSNARLIVCGPGDYVFVNCTFNAQHQIMIHEGARVTILDLCQSTLNVINRGYLKFVPNNDNSEKILNLNGSSSTINYGTIDIVGGLRVDAKLVNRGLINVAGSLWLNSNDKVCLADKSLMNVGGSSHINSNIRGDGGCLHSIGTVSSEGTNYVINSQNTVTPIDELVYICTESTFSPAFKYNPKSSHNTSGGAILQENCTGCEGMMNPIDTITIIDPDTIIPVKPTEKDTSYTIAVNNATICSGSTASLIASVKEDGNYHYRWVEILSSGEEKLIKDYSVVSKILVTPSSNTRYRVYVKEITKNKNIGSADASVFVLNASISISQDGATATLRASLADSYLWNNGAKSSYIEVPVNENGSYSVQMTKDGVTCSASFDKLNETIVNKNRDSLNVMIDGPQSLCPGSKVHLSAIVSGGSGDYEYIWNTGNNTSSISDSIVSTSDYSVIVKDKKLNIVGVASYRVNIPVWKIVAQTAQTITFSLNGNLTTYDHLSADTTLSVWMDNGSICFIPVKVDTTKEDPILPPLNIQDTIKTPVVIISTNPSEKDTFTNGNINVSICKGQTLSISLLADNSVSYSWLGIPNATNPLEVTPDQSTSYILNVDNADHTVHTTVKINVNVKQASYYVQKSSDSKNNIVLVGQGGSKYEWTIDDKTYTTQTLTVEAPKQPAVYYLTVDNVCFDSILVNAEDETLPLVLDLSDIYFCNNANATDLVKLEANVSGGSGSYSYSWKFKNQILTGESVMVPRNEPETYVLEVTDLVTGKKAQKSAHLFVMSAELSRKNESQVELIAYGGGTYLWNNGSTRSSITVPAESVDKSYSVVVENGGQKCSLSVNVPAVVPVIPSKDTLSVMVTSSSSSSSICQGESVTLSVDEVTGTGDYFYSWNIDGPARYHKKITVTPSQSYNYVVKVTDIKTGAIGFDSVYVNVLSANVDSISDNNSLILFAGGGTSYLWSNGATTSEIVVDRNEDITQYSVQIMDEYGAFCTQTIDVSKPSISHEPLIVNITGTPLVCEGESIDLSAVTSPACENCTYQWINNRAYTMSTIRVTPKNSETFTVRVVDTLKNREATASYKVDVMKVNLASIQSDGTTTLVASGGSQYVWSTNETTPSITVNVISQPTTYSVNIVNNGVTCEKQITVYPYNSGDPVICPTCPADFEISIDGNKQLCAGDSTSLTVNMNYESALSDFTITWDNVPVAQRHARTINVSSNQAAQLVYPLHLCYRPTGKRFDYEVKVAFELCYSDTTDTTTTFAPECGDLDLADGSYKLTDGVPTVLTSSPDSTNDFNSHNSYRVVITEAGKTYKINLDTMSVAYIYSDVATSLNMNKFNGTLILDGTGPFTFVKRSNNKYLSLSKTSQLIVNKGTNVIIVSCETNSSPTPAKMNESSKLYNRGVITVQGKFFMNNYSRLVNMGSFRIESGLTINDATCNLTNYNLMDIDRLDYIYNCRKGMFALEAGSVTKFGRIKSVNGSSQEKSRPFCGSGCVHITGKLESINVNHLASETVNVCMQLANDENSNKWGTSHINKNCSGCGLNVVPVNKVICVDQLVEDFVTLGVRVSGFSNSYHYEWILPNSVSGSSSFGGPLYPLELNVPVDRSSITSDYVIVGRVAVYDENNPNLRDTVDVSYTIRNCSGSSSDGFSVKVSDETVCIGESVILSAKIENAPSGECSYKWSTGDMSRSIRVSPSEPTSYVVEVTCKHNGMLITVSDTAFVQTINCGTDPCTNNLWVNVDKYPDCDANGELSFQPMTEHENATETIIWYNAQNEQIGTGRSAKSLKAGSYFVDVTYDGCHTQKKVVLKNAVNDKNQSGLQLSAYGSANASSTNYCQKKDTLVSGFEVDLSTIDAKTFVWTGFITPVVSGTYSFSANVGNGNLYVNNIQVIASNAQTGSISLEANKTYMIAYKIDRASLNQNYAVSIMWRTPSSNEEEEIPSCMLTPDPLDGLFSILQNVSETEFADCPDVKTTCPTPVLRLPSSKDICKSGSYVKLDAYVSGATYSWSYNGNSLNKTESSLNVSQPGIYSVTVTSWCGSSITKDVLVRTADQSGAEVSASSNVVCEGGDIQLLAKGGVSYEWSPREGLSDYRVANPDLKVGTNSAYSVKILTAGGCLVTKTVHLTIQEPFELNVEQRVDDCLGANIVLSASGADEYMWYPNEGVACQKCSSTEVILNNDSLVYTVEGLKNGCVVRKRVELNSLIKRNEVSFTSSRTANCEMKLTATDLGADVEYAWDVVANGELKNLKGREVSLYFPSNGTYRVTLKVRSKECDESSEISVTQEVKVEDCDPCNDTCSK